MLSGKRTSADATAGMANQFSVKGGSLKKEVILHKKAKWKSAQFRVGVL